MAAAAAHRAGHLAARGARQAAVIAATALAAALAVHLLLDLLPGDAATVTLGTSGADAVANVRAQWGLDQPPTQRAATWLTDVLRGDLGASVGPGRRRVTDLVHAPLERTALLAAPALLLAVLLGVGGGLLAGLTAGRRTDRTVSALALVIASLPEFVVATALLATLSWWADLLPQTATVPLGEPVWAHPDLLVLPVLTLGIAAGMPLLRWVRAEVATHAGDPHVEAAHLAGLPPRDVLTRHLLPVCAAPIAQLIALIVPYLVGGTVVVEWLFAYPGLGSLLVDRVGARDTVTVASVSLLLALVTVTAYRLADHLEARR